MRSVLRLALSLSLLSLSSVYAGDSDTGLCHPSSCPKLVDLSRIGRTDSGTRFRVDSTRDLAGALQSISLEDLQGIESSALRSFLKPRQVDPRETVVRVYDEDGRHYEERKFRFQSLPRDFVLDTRRRSEAIDGPQTYVPYDGSIQKYYAPLNVSPDVRVSPFPSRCD